MADISTISLEQAKLIHGDTKDFTIDEARAILGKEFGQMQDDQIAGLTTLFNRLADYYINQHIQDKIQKKLAGCS